MVSAESSALLPSGIINTIVTRSIGLALNGPFCVDPAGRRGFRDSQEEFSARSDAAAWVEGRSIGAYPEPTRKTNQHATVSAKMTFSRGTAKTCSFLR
jgi:hypothetical protein